jgi:hypothetical protein
MHRPAIKIVALTHTLPSPSLVSRSLPKENYKRLPFEVTPEDITKGLTTASNGYAWLAGAGLGASTSGFLGSNVFAGVNALYTSCLPKGPRSTHFMGNRILNI